MNIILYLLITISILYLVSKGHKTSANYKRSQKARVNAQKRYRLSNGKFSKFYTYANLKREASQSKGKRLVPVSYNGKLSEYITL